MLRTFNCIAYEHNPWLLALAVLVCLIAAATTMRLFTYGRTLHGAPRVLWLMAGGAGGGAGIWATHFISMLAYAPGLPTGYDPLGTAASLVVAIGGVGLGLVIAADDRRAWAAAVGGALVGVSIAAMHYTGMYAFRTEGVVGWNLGYIAFAVVAGIAFSSLALTAVSRRPGWTGALLGAVLLCVGIVALHFVSMAAVTITPDSAVAVPASLLPTGAMAIAVGVVAGLIMLGAAGALLLEIHNQRQALDWLNAIVGAMPDGLAYFDAQDRFLLWNPKYAASLARFGLTPERGRTYADCVLHPTALSSFDDAEARAAFLATRLAERRRVSVSRDTRAPDGRWLRVEENSTDDGGRVSVVFDITTLKENARDLALARDAAEAANGAKSEFLANMSHEIRTPLNGVLGVADALALTRLSSQQRELVDIIRTSGGTLNRLLCDILDLARVESGALELAREPFNLADAVKAVAQLASIRAEQKGIALTLDIAPDADRWVEGDPARLKQVLTTLAFNAVKFTDAGQVTLSAACEDEAAGRYRLTVRDTGPGFGEEVRSRLFTRFQQGDGAMNRKSGGAGLGLAIARQIAGLMGGDLEADSVEGQGAAFTFTVRLGTASAPAAAEPQPTAPLEGWKILVADDHPHNRRLLELLLSHLGVTPTLVEDGQAAVEAWRADRFDAVLMDMQMPVMDGLAATRAIRAAEREAGRAPTPILIVSANAMPEHVDAGRAAGADGHISKPIAADLLFGALASLVGTGAAAAAA